MCPGDSQSCDSGHTNGFPRVPSTHHLPCLFLPGLRRFLCAVSGCPACPAGGCMQAWSATVPSDSSREQWWRRSFPTLCTAPRTMTMTWLSCSSGLRSTSQVRLWPWNEQAGCGGDQGTEPGGRRGKLIPKASCSVASLMSFSSLGIIGCVCSETESQ